MAISDALFIFDLFWVIAVIVYCFAAVAKNSREDIRMGRESNALDAAMAVLRKNMCTCAPPFEDEEEEKRRIVNLVQEDPIPVLSDGQKRKVVINMLGKI